MKAPFIDREQELEWLNKLWKTGLPGFIIVYGRRRIGKTRLLMEWIKDKPHVYYQCLPVSDDVNLSRLARTIGEQLGLDVFYRVSFSGLNDILELLSRVFRDKLVIVLDEFTYWARYSSKVLGELQYFIDHILPTTRYMLVVCGSLVGVMHRSILSYGSPLYGRRTGSLKLNQLEPWYIKYFVKIKNKTDRVRVYALVGGLPHYLTYIYGLTSLKEVVNKLFGARISPIYDEPYMLFREEFRNPEIYYSIVSAIAHGHNRLSSIADYTGIERTHLPKYLRTLMDLDYIEYVVPIFSKRGRYRVKDPILRTWFKLIEPRLYLVEAGDYDRVVNEVLAEIDTLASQVFEDIARRYVVRKHVPLFKSNNIVVGPYIYKGIEIDLVILSKKEKRAHVYEIKWSDLSKKDLEREFKKLEQKIEKTILREYDVQKYIIARKAPKREYTITIDDMPL